VRTFSIAELILDELARAPTRPIRVPLPLDKRLRVLCEALLEAPDDTRTLADWARAAGASERTLARLFERELGTDFGQWPSRCGCPRRLADRGRPPPQKLITKRAPAPTGRA
jgi:AraC-like DNA-binding protein